MDSSCRKIRSWSWFEQTDASKKISMDLAPNWSVCRTSWIDLYLMRQCLRSWKTSSLTNKTLLVDIVGYLNIVQKVLNLGWIDYSTIWYKNSPWVSSQEIISSWNETARHILCKRRSLDLSVKGLLNVLGRYIFYWKSSYIVEQVESNKALDLALTR